MFKNDFNFCIVGFGEHAKNKILPALLDKKKEIFGIVTSKNLSNLKFKTYHNLDVAINNSNDNTIFILTTPPKVHFNQIKKIQSSNKNVFVEKPIFVSKREAGLFVKNSNNKNIFVAEMLMYKYTRLYEVFKKYFNKRLSTIKSIETTFSLPKLPKNTFREEKNIHSSILYDIGCYSINLFVDLKMSINDIKVKKFQFKHNRLEKLTLTGKHDDINIISNISINNIYQNKVKILKKCNISLEFSNFFYGRKMKKKVFLKKNKNFKNFFINDLNGFQEMFSVSKKSWLKSQKRRFKKIEIVQEKLESLSKEIL